MATLTVTARGQVTFRKEVLQHLGIQPGDKIELDLLADGRAALKASRPVGKIDAFIGLLAGKSDKVATLEELCDAAARGVGGRAMTVAVDTNVLVRAVTRDDPAQADTARKLLQSASLIAVPLPCLCEFV